MTISNAHIDCGGPLYCVGGFKFEMHPYCGPALIREDGELKDAGCAPLSKSFFKAFEAWQKLPQHERGKAQIEKVGRHWIYSESRKPVGKRIA